MAQDSVTVARPTRQRAPADEARTPEQSRPGALANACTIDLPPGDVIEAVEFERFFRLNLVYRDMVGPIVINLSGAPDSAEAEARPPRARRGWRRAESEAKAEGDDGSRVAAAEALNLAARTPVLLSDDPNAWARVSRAMPAIRPQTTHNGGRVWTSRLGHQSIPGGIWTVARQTCGFWLSESAWPAVHTGERFRANPDQTPRHDARPDGAIVAFAPQKRDRSRRPQLNDTRNHLA